MRGQVMRSATLIGVLLVAAIIGSTAIPGATPPTGQLIALRAAGRAGIFDPSLADTQPGRRAWMSYSAVDPSPRWPDKNTRTVTTRLAYSDDRGATWTDFGYVVNSISETATGSDAETWINEVSSLVFDPYAPAPERWKLFWHHYLDVNEQGHFQHSWIAYKAAPTPEALRSASEIKLFAGLAYSSTNNDRRGATGSPLEGAPLVDLHQLHKDLNRCVAASEPSGLASESGLYLSLSCYRPRAPGPLAILFGGTQSLIVLLRCDAPCRPASPGAWRYIATLLTPDDARAVGADQYSASDLFTQDGTTYLISSPVSSKPVAGAYNGCHVFRFTDIARGQLERNGTRPTILKQIEGNPNSFNGACTYAHSVTTGGFLYGEITFGRQPYFQIFQTGAGM
jgi:hypothetical protein